MCKADPWHAYENTGRSRFKKVLYTWLSIFLCQLPSTILRSTAFLKALNGSSSDFRLSIYFCKNLAKAWFWMFKKKITCLGKGSPSPLKKTKKKNLGQFQIYHQKVCYKSWDHPTPPTHILVNCPKFLLFLHKKWSLLQLPNVHSGWRQVAFLWTWWIEVWSHEEGEPNFPPPRVRQLTNYISCLPRFTFMGAFTKNLSVRSSRGNHSVYIYLFNYFGKSRNYAGGIFLYGV